jgi:hypothetical protein
MIIDIANSVQPSGVTSAVPRSPTARPIRVVTNASPAACERLRGLGFAVQVLDAAVLNAPSATDIDADIVVVDGNLTGMWSPLNAQKVNAPVVFINGLASPQADYGSDVINRSIDAGSSLSALKLAATFANRSKADPAEEGLTCGNLKLHDARGFWNGVDLGLTGWTPGLTYQTNRSRESDFDSGGAQAHRCRSWIACEGRLRKIGRSLNTTGHHSFSPKLGISLWT